MWEKIKNFFKWIADHTGISWVARKISSGWKWLFGGKANATQQNTSQQEKSSGNERQEPAQAQSKSTTTPKTLDNEVNPDQPTPPAAPDEPQGPVINTSETDAKELPENFPTPNLTNADSDVLKEASNENYLKVGDKGLLLVLTPEQFAKCKENCESTKLNKLLVYIKCDANEYRITGESVDKKTVSIESIKKKNENGQFKKISAKEILGNAMVKKVDSISNSPFEAPTLEQPNLNTTTTQQVVNNYTTIDQTTPSAVPNEPQETLVNAHEEKGEPNNAASNEEVQSEVSNKEVAAEEQAPNLNKNVDSKGGLGSEVSDNEGFEGAIKQPESLEVQEDEVANDMQNQGQSQNSNGMADPLAKPDQGSGDEPNQSSFDNESVKDDDKEADNPQPEISANGSAPTDSSSFDIVSSQETTPDELQEPDEDKELARQSEADQKAPANDDGPNSLVATPEVQTASNDKTSNEL